LRFVIGLMMVTFFIGAALAADVGFRGEGRGHHPDAEPPTEFSPEKNVVWAAPMPDWSNSCPVVVGSKVFVCAEPDKLIAVDKATGKILWTKSSPLTEALSAEKAAEVGKAKTHKDCGYTSATPVCDGKRVFAVFGNGVVAAFDLAGKRLWTRLHQWGHCASPVLSGGKLLVQIETLVALDPKDGTEVWRQAEEKWADQRKKRWGTCAATRIGDVDVVVTVTGRVIRASDGEILFSDIGNSACATPLIDDGVVYFMSGKKGTAVRLPKTIEGKPEALWTATTVKDTYFSSPILHDGVLYAIARRGQFSAFDAKTGEEIYQEKLLLATTEKEKNAAYSSVTLAGRALFFTGMDGSVMVVKPGRKYELIARNKVETALRSTPAFEGKRIYLRAPGHLYCFGE